MNAHAPEKAQGPLVAIGILFILTVGVSLLPSSWLGMKQEVKRYPLLDLSEGASFATHDRDSDGSVSWQEFISTSLDLPEGATTTVEADPRALAILNDPNNLTGSFTKNLYIASVALKESGITGEDAEQEAMNQLLAKEAEKLRPTAYTASAITLSSDSSKAALRTYGNSVASILSGLITEESIVSDLTSLTTFVESENEGDLAPLAENALKLRLALDKLIKIKVPASAAEAHVDALNRISSFALAVEGMSKAYDDPVRATFSLNQYIDLAVEALRAVPTLNQFFISQNVVFSSKEAGYLFTGGYTSK